jgi:hypothetical protein
MSGPNPIVPSVTSAQNEVPQINGHEKIADMTGYLVHRARCYAAIIAYPPRQELEIILVEPCPMCNGLEQSFSCDYCFQKNTIYWDKRHFVSKITKQ